MPDVEYFDNAETGMVIKRTEQGQVWAIPRDEGNRDYQEFLVWVAEGNTPEPWPPAE